MSFPISSCYLPVTQAFFLLLQSHSSVFSFLTNVTIAKTLITSHFEPTASNPPFCSLTPRRRGFPHGCLVKGTCLSLLCLKPSMPPYCASELLLSCFLFSLSPVNLLLLSADATTICSSPTGCASFHAPSTLSSKAHQTQQCSHSTFTYQLGLHQFLGQVTTWSLKQVFPVFFFQALSCPCYL